VPEVAYPGEVLGQAKADSPLGHIGELAMSTELIRTPAVKV